MNMKTTIKTLFFALAFCLSTVSFANSTTDAVITQSIQKQISANNTVSNLPVQVSTQAGHVVLVGKVNTDQEASALVQIAESTTGVNDVDTSQLVVKDSKQPLTDTYITAKVKGAFIRQKLFGDASISVSTVNVETTNGVVYLTGSVATQTQANTAIQLAKSVKGVKSVNSKLSVAPVNTNQ